ncbi:MAG: hypothetical protein FJ315_08285, partial [SAR202 cluster bacterium]|nr:hypothetical protein [SAR202 cluster bacterium]
MPLSLYVTAPEPTAGKTAICAGVAAALQRSGKKVGYFKPVVVTEDVPGPNLADSDVLFLRQALNLAEPAS